MDFQQILNRFTDVAEHDDGGYLAICPAHDDSRPSLRIWRGDDNKVRITCRVGCKPDDIVRAAGLRWADMFNATGEGMTVPKEPRTLVGAGHVATLATYVDATYAALWDYSREGSDVARDYLADRFGLTEDAAAELELGYSADIAMPYLSRPFAAFPRLTVPFRDFKGMPRGLQGRDVSGRCPMRWVGLSNPEGSRWALYGVFRGSGGYGVTLVTEGPSDALTAVSVGYDAVAVRGASLAGSPELARELAEGLRGTQVIVAGDHDPAGEGFTRRLADALKAHGIETFTLSIPTPGDDLNGWRLRDRDAFPYALHHAVKTARPVRGVAEVQAEERKAEVVQRTGTISVNDADGVDAAEQLKELEAQYGETDAVNAHALVAWTNGRIKYAKGLGFFVWNGRTWERSSSKVRQEIHRMGAALMLAGEREKARPFLMTVRINAMLEELMSVPSVLVEAEEFDSRPELLSFRNGVVDLRTGKLRDHDMADMLTVSLPLDYNENATCPRWEQFLSEIMPGMPEMVPYLRRLVGYGITGNTSEQCFAVLHGKGANGKSVFTDVLTDVFGSITKTTPFSTFEDKGTGGGIPNDIAALRGSRLVMASEGEAGKRMSEAVLKRVTGKDKVTARFLRQEFFTFSPTFLILLATNHRPNFRGQDEGLWRRVKLIPFERYFAPHERDYDLDRKLLAEAQGIVAWAVRGAVEWYAEGLKDPDTVTHASQEYRETSDALAGFLPGVFDKVQGSRILGAEVFNAYLDWCEAENLPQKERWTRRAFYAAMEERGINKVRIAAGMALDGIAYADKPATAEGPGIFAK
ncbi:MULTISPECIES: phage/plasmid primase, P4 family [Streptomyces]|uniref:phage/plasmid primase, P4 family n=1 Tax=Streptomyces TaxID=1883 RepID=UPI001601EBD0|nr:phage/plasmid primase, P4 family [Streptomyces murinus]MBA9050804.1 putative DNA primase/helicase [Streptomyces murinus]